MSDPKAFHSVFKIYTGFSSPPPSHTLLLTNFVSHLYYCRGVQLIPLLLPFPHLYVVNCYRSQKYHSSTFSPKCLPMSLRVEVKVLFMFYKMILPHPLFLNDLISYNCPLTHADRLLTPYRSYPALCLRAFAQLFLRLHSSAPDVHRACSLPPSGLH